MSKTQTKTDEALIKLREIIQPAIEITETIEGFREQVSALDDGVAELRAKLDMLTEILRGFTEQSLAVQNEQKQILADAKVTLERTLKNL